MYILYDKISINSVDEITLLTWKKGKKGWSNSLFLALNSWFLKGEMEFKVLIFCCINSYLFHKGFPRNLVYRHMNACSLHPHTKRHFDMGYCHIRWFLDHELIFFNVHLIWLNFNQQCWWNNFIILKERFEKADCSLSLPKLLLMFESLNGI